MLDSGTETGTVTDTGPVTGVATPADDTRRPPEFTGPGPGPDPGPDVIAGPEGEEAEIEVVLAVALDC